MAAAVAAATPAADNRCVGGGGGDSSAMRPQPQAVPLPSSAIPALTSSGGKYKKIAAPTTKISSGGLAVDSCSSSSEDDEDDGHHRHRRRGPGDGSGPVKPTSAAAVKRLEDLQHLVDLDDLQLLDRHLDADDDAVPAAGDGLAAELRQKNKDLVLAARLGKALLAKNDELSLMNERLAEEYGDKLEVITFDDTHTLFLVHTTRVSSF